jgi:L-asparagine transporter-like permease
MVEEHSRGLRHALASRHVSMIAIGGIIGAGLFVGSSTSIAQVGPGVIVSYGIAGIIILMVMRMLSEMAMLRPDAGSFTELVREGLGTGRASCAAGFTGISGSLSWRSRRLPGRSSSRDGRDCRSGRSGSRCWR